MQHLKLTCTILFACLLYNSPLNAQDLIVTKEGDSLNCRITKVEPETIYFSFKKDEEILSTLLPLDQITYYRYKFYPNAEVPTKKEQEKEKVKEEFPRFRAAINGGWSTRLAKVGENVPSDFEDYIKELKSGWSYGLDATYYWSKGSGIGVKYDAYKSKNEIDDIFVTLPDGSTQYGKLSDDITITFIGPFYSSRYMSANKKCAFLMNIGLGYVGYRDETVVVNDYTITGGTAGLLFDVGYDIGLSKTLAMGFMVSFIGGSLTQYDISDGFNTQTVELDEDSYEGLGRINLSVGLRFIK